MRGFVLFAIVLTACQTATLPGSYSQVGGWIDIVHEKEAIAFHQDQIVRHRSQEEIHKQELDRLEVERIDAFIRNLSSKLSKIRKDPARYRSFLETKEPFQLEKLVLERIIASNGPQKQRAELVADDLRSLLAEVERLAQQLQQKAAQ